MRIFVREVEIALKALIVVAVAGVYLVTLAWGFAQRREAERWRAVACSNRLKDVQRATRIIRASADGPQACTALDRLGLAVDPGASDR